VQLSRFVVTYRDVLPGEHVLYDVVEDRYVGVDQPALAAIERWRSAAPAQDEAEAARSLLDLGILVADAAADEARLGAAERRAAEGMPGTAYVTLLTTLACNLACDYCIQKDHPATGHMHPEVESAAVDWVVENAPRRAAVVILSDLLDADEQVMRKLAQLSRRKHEVTLFHVLDPAEIEFPFEDPTLFLSMEDGRSVEANGRDVGKGYRALVQAWLATVKREAAEADVDYALCRTDRPLDEVLLPFLARRERSAA